jgi:hypothetical protein
MAEARSIIALRDSIKKFEDQCSKIVRIIGDLSDEEMNYFEIDLAATIEHLHEEVDRQTRKLLETVKAKKPSEEVSRNDPAYTSYKTLLEKIIAAVDKTSNWFTSIFNKVNELMSSSKRGKIQKVFVDKGQNIGQNLIPFIIDELCDLVTRIFVQHRLFIHDIWQALQEKNACEPICNKLEADINEILQRWVRHFEMTDEKLKMRST